MRTGPPIQHGRGRRDPAAADRPERRPGKVPEGVWTRCGACRAMLPRAVLDQNMGVCPRCGHHHPMPAWERIARLIDAGTFEEWAAGLRSVDPLGFVDSRPYADRLSAEQRRTGLSEAAVVGRGTIEGIPVAFGVTDSRFIMGSMGSVVGEKLTRTVEAATRERIALLIVSGSGGGARLQEGAFSLMQMAKVAAALAASSGRRLPVPQRADPPDARGRRQLRHARRPDPGRAGRDDRLHQPHDPGPVPPRPVPARLPDQRVRPGPRPDRPDRPSSRPARGTRSAAPVPDPAPAPCPAARAPAAVPMPTATGRLLLPGPATHGELQPEGALP